MCRFRIYHLKNYRLKKKSRCRSREFGSQKKSRYRSQKFGSQKSLTTGLQRFGLKQSLCNGLKKSLGISHISRKKVRVQSFIVKFLECADIIFQRDTSNTLKRFCLIKCFNSSLKKSLSQDWSWYIAKGTTDPRHWKLWLIQHLQFEAEASTSFGILIKLKLTFFGKGQKVHRTFANPFYNLKISISVKILNQILNLMSY